MLTNNSYTCKQAMKSNEDRKVKNVQSQQKEYLSPRSLRSLTPPARMATPALLATARNGPAHHPSGTPRL